MKKKIALCFFVGGIITLVYFHIHGIFYPDEGYMLYAAKRMLSGQLVYKDFDFVYTPLTPILGGFSFLLFGESVLSGRIMAMFLSFATCISLFLLVRCMTKSMLYVLLVVLIYISWGPSHINFLWPSMVALSMGIVGLTAIVYALKTHSHKLFVMGGIGIFFVFLAKQNLGIASTISILLSLVIWKKWRQIRYVLLGYFTAFLLFLLYLVFSGSLSDFAHSLYVNLIQKIVIEGTISTPLIYGDSIYSYGKFLFYLSPAIISTIAIYVSYKKRSHLLIVPLFTLCVYIAGFRPVTDYVHLSPLLSLSGLSIGTLLSLQDSHRKKIFLISYSLFLILLGFYTALFFGYYRWGTPLFSQNTFVSHPRVHIFVDKRYATEMYEIVSYVDIHTDETDFVFINYYAPMIYFLINRENPTQYDYLSANAITYTSQNDIIKSLESKHVPLVMSHGLFQDTTTPIAAYIDNKYIFHYQVNDFLFWEKKKDP